jgi:hypothetical protein
MTYMFKAKAQVIILFIKNNITKGSSYGIQFFNASNNILLDKI